MKRDRHSTLSDVARLAGVGNATASRVLNGSPNVSDGASARVRQAIKDLAFVPNAAARVLKGDKSRTIGLIVPSIADPFFANCAETIQKVARSFGSLLIVIVTNNDRTLERESITALSRRTDGLLIAPSNSSDATLIELLDSLAIPIVTFDRPLSGSKYPAIVTDNCRCAKLATCHLLQHGYGDILCLGDTSAFYTMEERVRGYREALAESAHPIRIESAQQDGSVAAITAMLTEWQKNGTLPRAIFCLKNKLTVHTYHALQNMHVKIPEQVALIGYDDFPLAASLKPSITVVQQPVEEMSERAAQILFQKMSRETMISTRIAEVQSIRSRSRLILRASCGCMEPLD